MASASDHLENDDRELTDEQRKKLSNQEWRMNNLYYIRDKHGRKVIFRMNWAQRALFRAMWYLNIVLKARQLGMSTFIQLFMLDTCLFNSNQRALVIAHGQKEARDLFRDKIKYAYDNLPLELRQMVSARNDSAMELVFSNDSVISVGTSGRSGTFQMVHVSEFGKICRKYPERAREIVTGTFEAVHPGSMLFIESTAEGREGKFYELCEEARKLAEKKEVKLGLLDYKFWFLPWWKHPENVLDPKNILIYPPLQAYFDGLSAKHGITLTKGQKAWYAAKKKTLGDDIKREHPSTPEEAFEQIVEGAYYARALTQARNDGRVGKVPHQQGVQVDTYWDLGINDTMTCWFVQQVGASYHIIDYYENSGEGLLHYWEILQQKAKDLGYMYGRHVWPHDGGNRELGPGKTLQVQALEMGWRVEVQERGDPLAGIEAARKILSVCWFDEERCDHIDTSYKEATGGLIALESYRKEWDEKLGSWKRTPLHNWASHAADGFRTFAVAAYLISQGRQVTSRREVKRAKGFAT